MLLRLAVLAAGLLASHAGFTYSTNCAPPNVNGNSLKAGSKAYVCLILNNQVRAVFTPTVDVMSAFQITGANTGSAVGSGYWEHEAGWVPSHLNATACLGTKPANSSMLYSVLDVQSFDVSTAVPKVYKKMTVQCLKKSPARPLIDADTIPMYTAIIQLVQGKVSSITWDDGCFFCASNGPDCIHSTFNTNSSSALADDSQVACRSTYDTCYPFGSTSTAAAVSPGASPSPSSTPSATPSVQTATSKTNSTADPCDLKVYVVWTGTDSTGAYLKSAGRRFSRYRQFGAASLFQGALNVVNDGLNVATDVLNSVQNLPSRISNNEFEEEARRLTGSEEGHWEVEAVAGGTVSGGDDGPIEVHHLRL